MGSVIMPKFMTKKRDEEQSQVICPRMLAIIDIKSALLGLTPVEQDFVLEVVSRDAELERKLSKKYEFQD